jgi:hypothetical protein
MPGPPPPSQKDAGQVLRYAFDDEDGALRVDATISSGGSDLEIHYEDDSIAIGDPNSNNILSINADGAANVNVANSIINVPYDYVALTNTIIDAQTVPTTVRFYAGGSGGTLVATLMLTYDSGANLLTVTKTPQV